MSLSGNVISTQGSPIYVSPSSRFNGDLKRFTLNELKIATRNFRHGTITLQGHSTSVFKGWIKEPSLAAAKPGACTVVAVKKFNIYSSQDQQKWLVRIKSVILYLLDGFSRKMTFSYICISDTLKTKL